MSKYTWLVTVNYWFPDSENSSLELQTFNCIQSTYGFHIFNQAQDFAQIKRMEKGVKSVSINDNKQ